MHRYFTSADSEALVEVDARKGRCRHAHADLGGGVGTDVEVDVQFSGGVSPVDVIHVADDEMSTHVVGRVETY